MITPDFALVCMSRRRAGTWAQQTGRFFPDATFCVAEEERDDYRPLARASARPLLLHPDAVTGVGPVRQWILDHVPSRVVFMVPDDIVGAYGLTGTFANHLEPSSIVPLLRNTAECAAAAGAELCGFNQAWDVRKFTPLQPFMLNGWVDGPMGVMSRALRFDPRLKLHPDIDFALQHLQKFRIVWQDNRYAFAHDRWKQAGGNATNRTKAAHDAEFAYLRRKWQGHLSMRWAKGTFISKIFVERRQSGTDV